METMSCFKSIFLLEMRRFFTLKKAAILLMLLLISLYSGHKGIKENKETTSKIKEFQIIEVQTFKALNNYETLSHIGSRIMFIPAPVSIFFTNPPAMTEVSANINTVANLDISSNCQSKTIFISNALLPLRFSTIVFFLGTFAVLYIGLQSMKSKEYLKFLVHAQSQSRVYLSIFFSRYIFVVVSFLFIFGCTLCLAIIEGISLSWSDIAGLMPSLGVALLLFLFCLAIGTIPGHWAKKSGLAIILAIWFVMAIAIPLAFGAINEDNAETIPYSYKLFSNKLQVITDFEKEYTQTHGKFKESDRVSARENIEGYWNDHYPKMDNLEDCFKNEMKRVNKKNNALSIWFPTTFYQLTAVESSSRGVEEFLVFYDYLQALRKRYVRFWLNQVFYIDVKNLVNFIEGDMNIFRAQSRLPENFNTGILIQLGYILLAMIGSYVSFIKSLPAVEIKRLAKEENPDIDSKRGEVTALELYTEVGLGEKLYSRLDGKIDKYNKHLNIMLDNVEIAKPGQKQDFKYIPHPGEMPDDIEVESFIRFNARLLKLSGEERANFYAAVFPGLEDIKGKTFGQLNNDERGRVLLSVLPYYKSSIFLVNNIALGMSGHFMLELNDVMRAWAGQGAAVLYLTSDSKIDVERLRAEIKQDFAELEGWSSVVIKLKESIKEEHGDI